MRSYWCVYNEANRLYLSRGLFDGYEWTAKQRLALWFTSRSDALDAAAAVPGLTRLRIVKIDPQPTRRRGRGS